MSRIEKVNEQMKREIGMIIQQELSDPRLQFVSITNVDTSKDLRHAKVYFSVLGGQQNVSNAERGFEKARGIIRKYVGDRIKMRFTPELVFVHDRSLEWSEQIERTLKELEE